MVLLLWRNACCYKAPHTVFWNNYLQMISSVWLPCCEKTVAHTKSLTRLVHDVPIGAVEVQNQFRAFQTAFKFGHHGCCLHSVGPNQPWFLTGWWTEVKLVHEVPNDALEIHSKSGSSNLCGHIAGDVPLPRVTFEPRFLSQGCIFLLTSSAKGIFFTKTSQNWGLGAKFSYVFGKFILPREYKIGLLIRKWSLAQAMFSVKFSLTKGIRTGATTRPCQRVFGVSPPPDFHL